MALLLHVGAQAAPKPVRLFEVLAVRFTSDDAGRATMEAGMLNSLAAFRIFERTPVENGVSVPPAVINRYLITGPTWFAYDLLGSQALGNFRIGSPLIFIGEQTYFPLTVADAPKLDLGETVNLSTRASLIPGKGPIIAGFVIEGGARSVLIRAVGPGLAVHGVTDAVADPEFAIFRVGSGQATAANNDWGLSPDADAIERAAVVTGAFPLTRDSKDAACLVTLEAGVYSVQVTSPDPVGGTTLVEVYVVP